MVCFRWLMNAATSLMSNFFFFFNDTATTEIYTLSLHDALPIGDPNLPAETIRERLDKVTIGQAGLNIRRSEEHTSELQSHLNLVCRLLLEKKKKAKQSVHRTKKKHNNTLTD